MQLNNSLAQHLESNKLRVAAFHKCIKQYCIKSDEEIYEHIVNGDSYSWDMAKIQKNTEKIFTPEQTKFLKDCKQDIL